MWLILQKTLSFFTSSCNESENKLEKVIKVFIKLLETVPVAVPSIVRKEFFPNLWK